MSRRGAPRRRAGRRAGGRCALAAAALAAPDGSTRQATAEGPHGAYIPQPVMADMAAGFFTVTNTGGTDDRLTSVTSDIADDVTLHTHRRAPMRQVTSLTVPAGGELGSARRQPPDAREAQAQAGAGREGVLELHFAHVRPGQVNVPVSPPTYNPKPDMREDDHAADRRSAIGPPPLRGARAPLRCCSPLARAARRAARRAPRPPPRTPR